MMIDFTSSLHFFFQIQRKQVNHDHKTAAQLTERTIILYSKNCHAYLQKRKYNLQSLIQLKLSLFMRSVNYRDFQIFLDSESLLSLKI